MTLFIIFLRFKESFQLFFLLSFFANFALLLAHRWWLFAGGRKWWKSIFLLQKFRSSYLECVARSKMWQWQTFFFLFTSFLPFHIEWRTSVWKLTWWRWELEFFWLCQFARSAGCHGETIKNRSPIFAELARCLAVVSTCWASRAFMLTIFSVE